MGEMTGTFSHNRRTFLCFVAFCFGMKLSVFSLGLTKFFRQMAVCCAIATAALSTGSMSAHAQGVPNIEGIDASLFSQDLTDAVTQGFRQRDRVFFEEGAVEFEQVIKALQDGEMSGPILDVEAVFDDWEQLESSSEAE